MKRIIFGLLIMSLILMAGCGGGGSGGSKDVLVSLDLPEGWRVREEGTVVLMQCVNDQGGFFSVTKEKGAIGKNLEEHVEHTKSFHEENYRDIEWLGGTEKLRIDGRDAREITYLSNGFKQKDSIVVIHKTLAFRFSIVALEADFEGILDDYQAILDSVKFE